MKAEEAHAPEGVQGVAFEFKMWAEGVVTQGDGPDPKTLKREGSKP